VRRKTALLLRLAEKEEKMTRTKGQPVFSSRPRPQKRPRKEGEKEDKKEKALLTIDFRNRKKAEERYAAPKERTVGLRIPGRQPDTKKRRRRFFPPAQRKKKTSHGSGGRRAFPFLPFSRRNELLKEVERKGERKEKKSVWHGG